MAAREVMSSISSMSLTEEDCQVTDKLAITSLLHRFKDILTKYPRLVPEVRLGFRPVLFTHWSDCRRGPSFLQMVNNEFRTARRRTW